MIDFTPEENQLIERLSVKNGWHHPDAVNLKLKIKKFLLGKAKNCCCYCRRSMWQWHNMTIDVEHILPKGKFPEHTFKIENLNIACKRCNMEIKGEKTNFLTVNSTVAAFKPEHYHLIHPNLDKIKDHLKLLLVQEDTSLLIKYTVIDQSAKGEYAYNFFELSKIEVNTFDKAQNLETIDPNDMLPPQLRQEIIALVVSAP